MKKKQTFVVEIQDTQSQSWQGSVEWVQGQKKQSFRSVMELLEINGFDSRRRRDYVG